MVSKVPGGGVVQGMGYIVSHCPKKEVLKIPDKSRARLFMANSILKGVDNSETVINYMFCFNCYLGALPTGSVRSEPSPTRVFSLQGR